MANSNDISQLTFEEMNSMDLMERNQDSSRDIVARHHQKETPIQNIKTMNDIQQFKSVRGELGSTQRIRMANVTSQLVVKQ